MGAEAFGQSEQEGGDPLFGAGQAGDAPLLLEQPGMGGGGPEQIALDRQLPFVRQVVEMFEVEQAQRAGLQSPGGKAVHRGVEVFDAQEFAGEEEAGHPSGIPAFVENAGAGMDQVEAADRLAGFIEDFIAGHRTVADHRGVEEAAVG